MKLVDVYSSPHAARVLYDFLKERDPNVNISHKEMPAWERHLDFMASRPYQAWFLIQSDDEEFVGSIYVTGKSEVGLFIFKAHRRKGYGSQAFAELRLHHPERLLANISPTNTLSQSFFKKHGFKLIQETYIVEPN